MKKVAELNKTLWGISQTQDLPRVPTGIPLVEVSEDRVAELRRNQQFILKLSFWYLGARELAENQERESLLIEACQSLRPRAFTMSIPPSFVEKSSTIDRVHSIMERMKLAHLGPLYFDFGKLSPPTWVEPLLCVGDPLWDRNSVTGEMWKIHGWHPSRWVRRYSVEELARLKKLAMRHQPKYVILAHSQRLEQAEKWT